MRFFSFFKDLPHFADIQKFLSLIKAQNSKLTKYHS